MSTVEETRSGVTILSSTLHHIDRNGAPPSCAQVALSAEHTALSNYLEQLRDEINERPQSRAYLPISQTTEAATCLLRMAAASNLEADGVHQALAERLLRSELLAEDRSANFKRGRSSHLKKGSFVQILYREEPEAADVTYLGVKVEHERFLDETSFISRIGLGEDHKLYKACKIVITSAGEVVSALVFDMNATPAAYWWREMWELEPVRSDRVNTERAVTAVMKAISFIASESPPDYTLLRNATVSAFKQSTPVRFDDFVTNTFANYEPISEPLKEKLEGLATKLRRLPERNQFDGEFVPVASAVPYRQVKVKVTEGISVTYDATMDNLTNKIWSSRTRSGRPVLVIDAPDGAPEFPQKDWDAA
jgi:hypothetical protein